MVRPLLGSALCMSDFDESGVGTNMCSISCARTSYIDLKANRVHLNAPSVSAAGVRNVIQLFAVAPWGSVRVRVNDRGPFVRGRVVDVSHAAAETLGMVGGGIAKVKLDVVQ